MLLVEVAIGQQGCGILAGTVVGVDWSGSTAAGTAVSIVAGTAVGAAAGGTVGLVAGAAGTGSSAVGTGGGDLAVAAESVEKGIVGVVVYGLGRRQGFQLLQPFWRSWCCVLCGRASRKLVLYVHWGWGACVYTVCVRTTFSATLFAVDRASKLGCVGGACLVRVGFR
jgi:hypothetical protein